MQQLTEKQKKIAWIAGAVLLAIHFAPGFISNLRNAFGGPAPAVVQKQSAAHVAPFAPPAPPPSPEAIAAGKYGGIWAGSDLMPDQNRCSIRLEIRLSDDTPKKLKGYESKTCIPVQPFAGGKGIRGQNIGDIMRETSPVSAVMNGMPTSEGVAFTVDSLIGKPYDGCSLTGMTITDFGQGQVQAQWQSQSSPQAPCPDNRMLLKKARG